MSRRCLFLGFELGCEVNFISVGVVGICRLVMVRDIIVYDDDCGFCTDSVEFLASVSDRGYELVGFSDLGGELEGKLPEGYEECFHVVSGDSVFSCGVGVRYVLSGGDLGSVRYRLVSMPVFKESIDGGYEFIAENRGLVSKLL